MKTIIASTLLVAAIVTPAIGQVDDKTLVTTITSQDNPLRVNFTVPQKMNAEIHLYSEHCGQGNAKTARVIAQIYTTNGQKVGDEIKFEKMIGTGMQEITGDKAIELEPGSYYVTVESINDAAKFMKQGVNISVPGSFRQNWNYLALACPETRG